MNSPFIYIYTKIASFLRILFWYSWLMTWYANIHDLENDEHFHVQITFKIELAIVQMDPHKMHTLHTICAIFRFNYWLRSRKIKSPTELSVANWQNHSKWHKGSTSYTLHAVRIIIRNRTTNEIKWNPTFELRHTVICHDCIKLQFHFMCSIL